MDSGHVERGLASDHVPPSPSQGEAGVPEELGRWLNECLTCTFSRGWRHWQLPGAHHACFPSVPAGQPASLAQWAIARGSWALRGSVNCVRKGDSANVSLASSPVGHHLGCTELGNQGRPMASSLALRASPP